MYAVKIANEKYKGYSDRDRKLEEVREVRNRSRNFCPQGSRSINKLSGSRRLLCFIQRKVSFSLYNFKIVFLMGSGGSMVSCINKQYTTV